jgi:hypothetical protein
MIPVASGTAIQPVVAPQLQHPIAGMAVFTGTDHWKVERVVAVAMLAIIPGSFVFDSAFMNYLLAASLAVHAHWGLFERDYMYIELYLLVLMFKGMDTVLIDYCPRPALPLANVIRYALTAIAFGGLW